MRTFLYANCSQMRTPYHFYICEPNFLFTQMRNQSINANTRLLYFRKIIAFKITSISHSFAFHSIQSTSKLRSLITIDFPIINEYSSQSTLLLQTHRLSIPNQPLCELKYGINQLRILLQFPKSKFRSVVNIDFPVRTFKSIFISFHIPIPFAH